MRAQGPLFVRPPPRWTKPISPRAPRWKRSLGFNLPILGAYLIHDPRSSIEASFTEYLLGRYQARSIRRDGIVFIWLGLESQIQAGEPILKPRATTAAPILVQSEENDIRYDRNDLPLIANSELKNIKWIYSGVASFS